MRTCIGCRTTLPQDRLVRVVLDGEDVAVVSRTAPGRGAWLCSDACIAPAVKRRGFERAWRRPVRDGALAGLGDALRSTTLEMKQLSVSRGVPGGMTPTKG